MNKARRARIAAVVNAITEQVSELESIRDEEQEAFDNMPESLQNGEKGEAAQAAIDNLESAINDIESMVSNLEAASE